jgi:subtilisin family serine protease
VVDNVASLLRRLGLVLAVVATLLVAPGTTALAASASGAGSGAASTSASVAPAVSGEAAKGEVRVIAVTRVPGEQVVDAIAADLPPAAADTARGGKAKQVAVTVDAEGLAALAANPDVVQVVENKVNRITADAWTTSIGLAPVLTAGWDGTGRTIAVLDVGVQVDHPYLAGKVTAEACFSQASFAGQVQSLCPGEATETHTAGSASPPCDSLSPEVPAGCGHGTHVAGIAGGGPVSTPSDLTGVAPGASIIAMKVFTKGMNATVCQGAFPCLLAYDSDIANALAWLSARRTAADPLVANLDAVNLSLGGGSFQLACDAQVPTVTAQVNALRAQGIATVVAAGNNGQNGAGGSPARMASPACISTAVSVGATTNAGAIASFSNLTAATTIVAPGSSITSSKPTSTYGLLSGTSMASPVVAGAIAALREKTPAASVTTLVDQLRTRGSQLTTAVGQIPELQLDSALVGVPSDVGRVAVTSGFERVSLGWSPPSFTGASVASYTVTASPGGASCVSSAVASPGCAVTGLVNGSAYTFTITATNAQGTGSGTSVSAAPRALTAGSPFGSFDLASAGPGSVTVAGWAIDPDTVAPIPVHVYVDGTGTALTANGSRPDVDAAFGYGANHGFGVTVPASGGSHTVCAYGINVAAGSNVLLGCRVVPVPSGSPFGSLDMVGSGLGSVSVAGWAIDPDTVGSIQVHVYVDGSGYALDATSSRPDVGAAYAGYGSAHGFGVTVPASPGSHTVCAYAINVGAGSTSVLGCRVVSVPSGSPFGSLDVARRNPDGSISVSGWAIDPDTAADIQVHVYFVGPTLGLTGIPLIANQARGDVGAVYPAYGSAHGYSMVSPAFPAGVTLCAYGINVGSGGTSVIGCAFVP